MQIGTVRVRPLLCSFASMLSLFQRKPLFDEDTTQWLWESYAWALKHFNREQFFSHAILVTPSKAHFPDQAENHIELANQILLRVKHYAGMENWPTQLIVRYDEDQPLLPSPSISTQGQLRGDNNNIQIDGEGNSLPIYYQPDQAPEPNVLIAMMAQSLASPLVHLAQELPPGGRENLGPATDLVTIFMGFGIFMSNTAFNYSIGGCGSCKPRGVQMLGDLTEHQMTYALALFCALKEVPKQDVLPHLKNTLRPFFKKALKEISARREDIASLKAASTLSR